MAAFILYSHVAVSLLGIGSGIVVLYGLLTNKRLDGWTAFFLATTVATNASGFLFPFEKLLPSHILAIISLVVLAVSIYARYAGKLVGFWRLTYVITAVFALYVNIFVLVVQSFLKVPALHALAPTQKEPPFAVAQLVVLVAFIAVGIASAKKFRGGPTLAG